MRDNYKIIVKFAVRIIPEETAARSLVRQMELGVNIHLFRVDDKYCVFKFPIPEQLIGMSPNDELVCYGKESDFRKLCKLL